MRFSAVISAMFSGSGPLCLDLRDATNQAGQLCLACARNEETNFGRRAPATENLSGFCKSSFMSGSSAPKEVELNTDDASVGGSSTTSQDNPGTLMSDDAAGKMAEENYLKSVMSSELRPGSRGSQGHMITLQVSMLNHISVAILLS